MKFSKMINIFSLCFYVFVSDRGIAACPGDPKFDHSSILRLTSPPIQPVIIHNLTTAQIQGLRKVRMPAKGMHNPGLTIAEQSIRTDYQIAGSHRGKGPYCVWADSLNVEFCYTKMDVYVSSQYAEGSCPYQVILEHENQHVAINQRVLQKYFDLIQQALKKDRSIPTKANPMIVPTLERGKTAIAARVDHVVTPLYKRFIKEVASENAKIDTLANYKRTQAKCKEWP